MPEKNGETYLKYSRKENISQGFVSGKTDFYVQKDHTNLSIYVTFKLKNKKVKRYFYYNI